MSKLSRVLISFLIIANMIFSYLAIPVNAAEPNFKEDELSKTAKDVVSGKKVPMSTTIPTNGKSLVKNRYVAFIKSNKVNDVLSTVSISKKTIGSVYGEVTAVPFEVKAGEDVNSLLKKLDSNPDVIAISQAVKRSPMAVTAPNDPYFPANGEFTNPYQWYLSPSSGGNYGIDIMGAWNKIDTLGKDWKGDPNVIVAVIDSGVAYENYTKYSAWDFAVSPDMTTNIYSNAGETANNGVDDDNNGIVNDYLSSTVPYCLDANANGQCDAPGERTKGYIDDKNGLSIVDFVWHWEPDGASSPSLCSNAPYTSYYCVQQRYCEKDGLSATDMWGCGDSDMGHPNDLMGHGTVVSNIIAGKVNNSARGAGIAPNVTILPIQLFGYYYSAATNSWVPVGGDSIYVAQAVEYAVNAGAKVINMSFSGDQYDLYEELAMNSAYVDHDVLLVAASGNTGTIYGDVAMYPASYASVLSVGASNKDGTKASYSIYKSKIEISAPVDTGVAEESYLCYFTPDSETDGNSCLFNNTSTPNSTSQFTQFAFGYTAGTSFAAPQVSGVAALIRSTYPTLSASAVRSALKMGSTPIGSRYNSQLGYGILNAANSLKMIDSRGLDISGQRVIIQGTSGADKKVKVRYSYDGGITWTGWSSAFASYDEVGLPQDVETNKLIMYVSGYQGYLYEWKGTIVNDGFYGTSLTHQGYVKSAPRLLIADGRWLMTFRSSVGKAYTRYSDDNGDTWSLWNNGGYVSSNLNFAYSSSLNRIVQTTRSTTGVVLTRYSNNKGTTWSGWSSKGNTTGEITIVRTTNRFVEAMRGTDGYSYTRYSADGISWSAWTKGTVSLNDVAMAFTGDRLVQAVRSTSGRLYTRYSTNEGTSWSGWTNTGKVTIKSPTLYYDKFFDRLLFTYVDSSSYINTAYSENDGATWLNWSRNGQSYTDVTFGSVTYNNW